MLDGKGIKQIIMYTTQDYLLKLGTILGQPVINGIISYEISGHWDNDKEACALIAEFRLKQKELSLLKKSIHATIQEISKSYITQRIRVGKSVRSGFMRGLFGSRTIGRYNMLQRNGITIHKDQAVRPYRQLIENIDNIILAYEKQKVAVEEKLLSDNKLRG